MAKTRAKKKGAKVVTGPPANARLVRARAAKTAAADKAKKQKTTGTGSTGSKNPVKSNGGGRRKGGAAASTKTSAGRKTAGATSRSSGRKRKQRTASSTIAATAAAASVAASASTAIVAATTADFKVVKSTDTKSEVHDKITHNAIIVITIWTAEDEDNERCIKDGFCRGGTDSARRKELIARLYNQVYKKLPRTYLTKAGSKRKLNYLRARDYLSKNRGYNLNHLLAATGLRKTLITGDNKGQVSSEFAHHHKFEINAEQNLQEGKGVAASLKITEELSADLIGLTENGRSVTQQFNSFHSALLYVRDALKPVIPNINKVVTLSPEKYLELCKNVDPNTETSKLLNALAQRDATSLRCQSGACLQVAVYCVSQRLYERRLRAIIKKDGTRDILSMVSEFAISATMQQCIGVFVCSHVLIHYVSIFCSQSIYRSLGSAWTLLASGTRSRTIVTIATSRSAPAELTSTISSTSAYIASSRGLKGVEQAEGAVRTMTMGWVMSPSATTTTSARRICRRSSGGSAWTNSATQPASSMPTTSTTSTTAMAPAPPSPSTSLASSSFAVSAAHPVDPSWRYGSKLPASRAKPSMRPFLSADEETRPRHTLARPAFL